MRYTKYRWKTLSQIVEEEIPIQSGEQYGCFIQLWIRRAILPQHLPSDTHRGEDGLQAVWYDQIQLWRSSRGSLGSSCTTLQDSLQVDKGHGVLAPRCCSSSGRGSEDAATPVSHPTGKRPFDVPSHLLPLLCSLPSRLRPVSGLPCCSL